MPKGFAVDIGRCGFGWGTKPPSLRLGIIAFYWLENGLGVIVLGYRAALIIERGEVGK